MVEETLKIRQIRQMTSLPIMDCKRALDEADGDVGRAIVILRQKAMDTSESRSGKSAMAGIVALYNHGFGRIGVIVEVRCETDFGARTTEFQRFANAVAIHIAWANPEYISRADIPADVVLHAKEVARVLCDHSSLMEEFYAGCCLLDQVEQKESKATMTIGQMLEDLKLKMGENIRIVRFSRYELGRDDNNKH